MNLKQISKYPNCFYRVSVKAIIVRDNKVLVVKENTDDWELPGGGIDHGESLEQALKRELKEEVGLKDTNLDYQIIGVENVFLPDKQAYNMLIICSIESSEMEILENQNAKYINIEDLAKSKFWATKIAYKYAKLISKTN